MLPRQCKKCGRPLPLGCSFYEVKIAVQQGFDGIIEDSQAEDLKTLMAKLEGQTAGVPEHILEEEVHKEFSFNICPRCKEKYCANPLNLPLDARHVPKKTSDLD